MKRATHPRCLMAAFAVLGCPGAYAAWVVQPSAELRGEYDTNVRLSEEDEEAFVTNLAAQAQVRSVTERSFVAAIGGINLVDYSAYNGPGNLNDRHNEFLTLSAQRDAERSAVGIRANLRRDDLFRQLIVISDDVGGPSGEFPPAPIGDPNLDPIDPNDPDLETVNGEVSRFVATATPYYQRQLTQRMSASLGYTYYQSWLDSDAEVLGFSDATSHSVNLGLERALTEVDQGSLTIQAGQFQPDSGFDSDTYQAMVGWTHRFTEIVSGTIEVGGLRTESDLGNDSNVVYRGRLERRALTGRDMIEVERSVVPNSYADLTITDRVTLRSARSISQRWGVQFQARALTSESLSGIASVNDRDLVQVQARVSYDLTEAWSVGALYQYRWMDRADRPTSADGHAVGVSVVYQPPTALR